MRKKRPAPEQIVTLLRQIGVATSQGNGRLRDECLNEHLFASLPEARRIMEEWRTDHNTLRPHSSLNGLTPTAFATRPTQGHTHNRPCL